MTDQIKMEEITIDIDGKNVGFLAQRPLVKIGLVSNPKKVELTLPVLLGSEEEPGEMVITLRGNEDGEVLVAKVLEAFVENINGPLPENIKVTEYVTDEGSIHSTQPRVYYISIEEFSKGARPTH